jgi:hypothetical protein
MQAMAVMFRVPARITARNIVFGWSADRRVVVAALTWITIFGAIFGSSAIVGWWCSSPRHARSFRDPTEGEGERPSE